MDPNFPAMPIFPAMAMISRAAARELDRRAMDEFGVPGVILMENAGRGVAELLIYLDQTGTLASSTRQKTDASVSNAASVASVMTRLACGNPAHQMRTYGNVDGEVPHPWERRLPEENGDIAATWEAGLPLERPTGPKEVDGTAEMTGQTEVNLPNGVIGGEDNPSRQTTRRVVIVCGRGNNGGDGFVIARHLSLRGYTVELFYCGEPAKYPHDAAVNANILRQSGFPMRRLDDPLMESPVEAAMTALENSLRGAVCVVDALLGTGAMGEPRPPMDLVIEQLNASGTPILAVDLPSGLDADSGLPSRSTIHATHTATFVAQKPGFFLPSAIPYVGRVHVIDIGAPPTLVEQMVQWPY